MSDKQASGFGYGEKSEAFELNKNANSQGLTFQPQPQPQTQPQNQKEKQITLNISEAKGEKISLRRKLVGTTSYTGNPVMDFYNKFNDYLIEHSKIKVREKATFFRLLAVMLNAGLSMIKSLYTLSAQSAPKSPRMAKTLIDMAKSIEGGRSLSDAMGDYPDIFTDAQVGIVKSGEASGQMNRTLKTLADEVEKSASITGKIKGAMVYPVVIFVVLIVVIFLMMTMVVPQMSTLFTESGKELPLPTQIMISISDFCVNYWYILLLIVIGAVVAFSFWRKTRSGRYILDFLKLKMPIFGAVFQKGAISKFSRSFSNLLGSGVPIIKSMEISAYGVGNEVYKRRLILASEDMKRGIPLAENMAESNLFPTMLVNMIEVGEQTAQLDNVVLKVAEFYDEEIDNVVASLSKIMEPIIMVVIGVTVGGMVAAIMLPIMQMTNFAGSG